MPCKYYKLKLSFKSFILFASWIVLAHFAICHCRSRTKFHVLCKSPCNISEERENTLTFVICHINNLNCSSYPQEGQSITTFAMSLQKLFPPWNHFTNFSKWHTILQSDLLLKKVEITSTSRSRSSFKMIALTTITQYTVYKIGTFYVWNSDFKT